MWEEKYFRCCYGIIHTHTHTYNERKSSQAFPYFLCNLASQTCGVFSLREFNGDGGVF